MKRIPVFFIDGFLDSGKTTFIVDVIKTDGFDGKTLLLVCEEGEVEYDCRMLKAIYNTDVEYFSSQEDFDYIKVGKMLDQYKPDRVVIEMNGMWDLEKLQFPRELDIMQVIYFIDTTTFGTYFNNMRQKFVDIIKRSSVVCFINCTDSSKQIEPYRSALKMINSNTQFMIMDKEMRAKDAFEEPLPYDIEQDVIKIEERDYGTFYIDTFDHKERYDGKTVEYDIMVVLSEKLPPNSFIAGRFIMNCCADDIQLFGFLADDTLGLKLKDRQWIHLKANISYEWSEEYNEEELVLKPISIDLIEGPKDKVLDLTK